MTQGEWAGTIIGGLIFVPFFLTLAGCICVCGWGLIKVIWRMINQW